MQTLEQHRTPASTTTPATPQELYLDLMKKCLTRLIFPDVYQIGALPKGRVKHAVYAPIERRLARRGLSLARRRPFSPERRSEGLDWPIEAETMVGIRRLDNIQALVCQIIRDDVPGDLIETGVWRGGAAIFMRAVLAAYDETSRIVWAADSFQGLPQPDAQRYPADAGDILWTIPLLAVSLEQVQANFARYGLLDDQVRFLPGWFKDTLPAAPIERLALIRLDGDLYESTIDALRSLYPRLSLGGYVIIDDYFSVAACPRAVSDFRSEHGITDPLQRIDRHAVYWRRAR